MPGLQIGYEHTFVHQVADFLKSLEEGKPASPTFRDALETQKVCDAVLNSAKDQSLEERVAPSWPAEKSPHASDGEQMTFQEDIDSKISSAIERDDADALQRIIVGNALQAHPDLGGWLALASKLGKLESLKRLLACDANVNWSNADGETPFSYACAFRPIRCRANSACTRRGHQLCSRNS